MKTIAELKKSATVLDRKQLKNLLGGKDEHRYVCTVSILGGAHWSGPVDGIGKTYTEIRIFNELVRQGWDRKDIAVSC